MFFELIAPLMIQKDYRPFSNGTVDHNLIHITPQEERIIFLDRVDFATTKHSFMIAEYNEPFYGAGEIPSLQTNPSSYNSPHYYNQDNNSWQRNQQEQSNRWDEESKRRRQQQEYYQRQQEEAQRRDEEYRRQQQEYYRRQQEEYYLRQRQGY